MNVVISAPDPGLLYETERLWVRRLQPQDLDRLVDVYGDPDAMRHVGDGLPLGRADCERWIDVTEANLRRRGYGMSAVVERGSGRVIGFCGLVHPGSQPEPEVKYAFSRDCWGLGYATEAVRGMLAWGASVHGLRRIIATVAPAHAASQRVLQKAGLEATDESLPGREDTRLFVWAAPELAGNE